MPIEESVRRTVAIQMTINKELRLTFCENSRQGGFIVAQLTDLVEQAVYTKFETASERGGVLGPMDTMFHGKIREGSLYYEHKKHDGSLRLVGVNTFLPKEHAGEVATEFELRRRRGSRLRTCAAGSSHLMSWHRWVHRAQPCGGVPGRRGDRVAGRAWAG